MIPRWLSISSFVLNAGLVVLFAGTGFYRKTAAVQSVPERPFAVTQPTFHWSQLEATDYPTYIANLRGIGCPEETIRDLITAELAQRSQEDEASAIAAALPGVAPQTPEDSAQIYRPPTPAGLPGNGTAAGAGVIQHDGTLLPGKQRALLSQTEFQTAPGQAFSMPSPLSSAATNYNTPRPPLPDERTSAEASPETARVTDGNVQADTRTPNSRPQRSFVKGSDLLNRPQIGPWTIAEQQERARVGFANFYWIPMEQSEDAATGQN